MRVKKQFFLRFLFVSIALLNTAKSEAKSKAVEIVRSASKISKPLICSDKNVTRRIDIEAIELDGFVDDKKVYRYWTYNGQVPAPLYRVCENDSVEVHFKSHKDNQMLHSIDFHAATGEGGGAVYTKDTEPGEERVFTFKALKSGVYVYHCATPVVSQHISKGQYGLIIVQPIQPLPAVDKEFYVMQGEIYADEKPNDLFEFSYEKLINETPTFMVFNGKARGLTGANALKAKVGEKIRIYFGVGGPNIVSSFHIIGLIFENVFNLGSLSSPSLKNIGTALVPAGGSVVVDFKLEVPGKFLIVDHSLARLEKGLVGELIVSGPEVPEIFKKGAAKNNN
jgi:nitrite reductase (NO-forming)